MKFLLSISLYFFVNQGFTRELVVINSRASLLETQTLKKVIQNKFNFPSQYIVIHHQQKKCELVKDSLLQICLNEKGEMEVMRKNDEVLEKLRLVFVDNGEITNE